MSKPLVGIVEKLVERKIYIERLVKILNIL